MDESGPEREESGQGELALALRLKKEGQEQVERNNKEFVETMRSVAVQLGRRQNWVTTDDLQEWADREGFYPKSHNVWGTIIIPGRELDESGLKWEAVGTMISERPSAHGRPIRKWRLTV